MILTQITNFLSSSTAKDDAKKIFIFTNDDNPVRDDASFRTLAIQKARDLAEMDIVIELFPKARVGATAPFDPMAFYKVGFPLFYWK